MEIILRLILTTQYYRDQTIKAGRTNFTGLSILVKKGSKNITIKNAEIHGYKVAILADSVKNITIDNCDLSYNWRQHLQSNREREDISDWMSYHKNENDEWLRYGAAIYLKNCSQSFITNNIVTGGQCALMMTRCEKIQVNDNNFSFNSGIGIGLYRSSNNKIYHNRIDYNIRGVSFGKYNRGQDSAGILVFEQSSNNVFAYNTATHSGDGFFLWAGQTTMDTGLGGCNDNFIYGNDFSYAPTNGIEVTFSSNLIMKNILKDCDHGVWGGYSYETDITDNRFENNRIGIAIEHGQAMNIVLNSFRMTARASNYGRAKNNLMTGSMQKKKYRKPQLLDRGKPFYRQRESI
jgi:parallel beta-helix repeat protein